MEKHENIRKKKKERIRGKGERPPLGTGLRRVNQKAKEQKKIGQHKQEEKEKENDNTRKIQQKTKKKQRFRKM